MLSPHPNPALDDEVYEISIGWEKNSLIRVSRHINGEVWQSVNEQGLLSKRKPVKVIVEVSNEGVIKIFTSHNIWTPALTIVDTNPINVKFISFSSSDRVQFFYDVNENELLEVPKMKPDDELIIEKYPLFTTVDYPVGMSELYFQKYYKHFITTTAVSNKYVQFIKMEELKQSRPDNYIVRVPFYIRGSGNAHVLLSEVQNPTPLDNAYELIVGAWNNQRIILRKRVRGSELVSVPWPNVLSDSRRKKFVLEITSEGMIKLFMEDSPYLPVLRAFDPEPVKVQFMSFKNYLTEHIDFWWGDKPELPKESIFEELITINYGKKELHPLFVNWEKLRPVVRLPLLVTNGKYIESWNELYDKVMPIEDKWKPSGYVLRMPFWIQGSRDAHIVLSTDEKPNRLSTLYEIRIGSKDNSLITIAKQIGGEHLHRVYEENLLSWWKPTLFVLEVTQDGTIQLFSSHNPYAPLLTWKDPQPLPIKYVSLGSLTRVQFILDVKEDSIISHPVEVAPVDHEKIKHPLLSVLDLTLGIKDMRK